jgi:hypothetical protein
MLCRANDVAEPAAVQALKEYRDLVKRATGVEPARVEAPEPGNPRSSSAAINGPKPPESHRINYPPKASRSSPSARTSISSAATRPRKVPMK